MSVSKNNIVIKNVNLNENQMSSLIDRCELIKRKYLDAIASETIEFNELSQLYVLNIQSEVEEYYIEFMVNESIEGNIIEIAKSSESLDRFVKSILENYYPTEMEQIYNVEAYKSENDIYRIDIKKNFYEEKYLLLWGYSKSTYKNYHEAINQYIRFINSQFNYIEECDIEEDEYGMPVGINYKTIIKDNNIADVNFKKISTPYTIDMDKEINEMNEFNNDSIEELLNMDTEEINSKCDKFEFEFFTREK